MESQTQTSTSTLQPTSSSSSSSNPPDYPTSQTLPIFSQFKSYISLLEKELEEKADPKLKSTKRNIRVKISGWSEKESQNQDKSRNKQDDESKQVDEVEGQLEIQVKNLGRCFINFEVSSSSSTTSKSNSNPNESSNSDSSKRQHHALRISRINLLSQTEVSSFKPTSLDSIQINKLSNFPIFKELSGNLFKGCLTCPSTRGDHHPLMSLTSTIFQLNSFRFFFESPPPSLLVVMQQLRTAEKVEATLPGKKVEVEGEKVREEDQGKGKEKEIETGDSEMKDGNETQEEEKERNQNGTKNAEVGIKFKPSGPKLWTWRKVLQPKIGDGKIRWVWCSQNQDRNEGGNGSEKLGEVDLTREQEERENQGEWRAYHSNCTLRM